MVSLAESISFLFASCCKVLVVNGGAGETQYVNEYIGISYKINDDVSISYNEMESLKSTGVAENMIQEFDSISLSYSIGGMVIGIADAEVSNSAYNSGRSQDETSVSLSIAF